MSASTVGEARKMNVLVVGESPYLFSSFRRLALFPSAAEVENSKTSPPMLVENLGNLYTTRDSHSMDGTPCRGVRGHFEVATRAGL